jgi:lycopene beta-cyclase
MQHYHYIFTGSGLSALMTVYEMVLSGKFEDKTILLIDENAKKTNDRTWCFWDERDIFPSIILKKWETALFADKDSQRTLQLHPYQYKMIQGLDFYNLVFNLIENHENIQILNQKVTDFEELESHCVVKTETESYTCNQILNSIFNPEKVKNQSQYPFLHQHFIGWFIKSKEAVFNPSCATFMDFSIEQKGNTRFMYVLPTSKTEALLEYTLFSQELLQKEEYETEIQNYIQKLGITNYEIVDKEQGNIPMTSYPFWKYNTKRIIHIGSAGGWTKASTGYTFKNATKKVRELIRFLQHETDIRKFHKKDKFWFYDLLFLDVLNRRNDLGWTVFSALFQKGNPTLIFKFLDEETSFWEDVQVIWKCPKTLFVRALFERFINLILFNNRSNN